ncbi:MAG TPA: hypothetical protein VGP37_02950 [Candidatus Nanopelagicales bacterium]|nr:hypothetical protein [Candidatus Nanopelagicales bacterium]
MRSVQNPAASLLAGALVGALVLTGCSSTTESATEEMVEEMIESESGGDVQVEIDDDSMSVTDEEGGQMTAGDEAELPPAFPDDIPLFTAGTLIAAVVLPDEGFTATWRMAAPDDAPVEAYIKEWENAGFTQSGFLDMSSDSTRMWTYQMTSPDLEVAISATIAGSADADEADATDESLVSITGAFVE